MKHNHQMMIFFEMLLLLLRGKTSLIDALQVLSGEGADTRTGAIACEVLLYMKKGMPFSDSLTATIRSPWRIPHLYITLIQAAEKIGTIDHVLQEIVDDLKQKQKTGEHLIAALAYPVSIILIALIGTGVILFKGIPLFIQTGFVSKDMMSSTTYGIVMAGLFLLMGGGILAVVYYKFFLKESQEYTVFYILSFLLKARVPLSDALSQCIESMGDTKQGQALLVIKKEITGGSRLYHAFTKSAIFSPYIINWLSIADKNGRLDEICQSIAEHLRQKYIQRKELAAKCIEPAAIIVTGIYLLILLQNVVLPLLTHAGGLL
jgi:type IV pilus assembly protein PilC